MIPLGDVSTWEPYGKAPFYDWESMVHFLDCVRKQNDDSMILVDGPEGAGKSTLLFHLAHALDETWHPETGLIIDYDDWEEVYSLEPGKTFILDEGGDLLFSRNSQTRESKLLVRMFQMSRIYNHTLLVACPNIHWVDLYIRSHRALIYGHVHKYYHPDGVSRGLATWNWPKRGFDRKHSEWTTTWNEVYDLRFHAVPPELPLWQDYERFKKLKVQKRQLDLSIGLSR